jgi:hypothetical protein
MRNVVTVNQGAGYAMGMPWVCGLVSKMGQAVQIPGKRENHPAQGIQLDVILV